MGRKEERLKGVLLKEAGGKRRQRDMRADVAAIIPSSDIPRAVDDHVWPCVSNEPDDFNRPKNKFRVADPSADERRRISRCSFAPCRCHLAKPGVCANLRPRSLSLLAVSALQLRTARCHQSGLFRTV